MQPSVSRPVESAGLLVTFAETQPLSLASTKWPASPPCPLRWLPAGARRMAIADSPEAAGEFFWLAGLEQPPGLGTHG